MNLFAKQKQTGLENKLMVTGDRGQGEIDWEFGIDMYKLLYGFFFSMSTFY